METPPREAYKVKFPFICPNHPTEKAEWDIYDCVERGTPTCPECGDDMELVGPTDTREVRASVGKLPPDALAALSDDQRTYLDEFTFIQSGETIEGWYAGQLLAVWDGKTWDTTRPRMRK